MRPFKAFNQLRPLYTSRFGPLCSLSLFCPSFFFSHSPRFSTLDHKTFMEVVKAVSRQGSVSCESVAIRADQKSYTYSQLMQSAWRISRLLCNGDQKTVDGTRGNDHLAGARIGIVAKPSAEFVAGILGTWFSGGVAVPLALSYPEAELLHVMNDSKSILSLCKMSQLKALLSFLLFLLYIVSQKLEKLMRVKVWRGLTIQTVYKERTLH
ncbi:hypothetical protein CsSME_00052255 [Camellia sinensis var. sinensis]